MKAKFFLAIILVVIVVFCCAVDYAQQQQTFEPLIQSLDFGSDDAELLMKFAQAEAPDAPARTKALIMLVILNRAWHPNYPDSIKQVILSGDFESVRNGDFFIAVPDEQCEIAINMIYQGWNKSNNVLELDDIL